MSYITTATAETILGQAVAQEHLDWARAIIDQYSEYRWESTSVTETFSGDGENTYLKLYSPIISVTSLTIDDVAQTEDTDFEIRKVEGFIRSYSGLPFGHDNIAVVYAYGFVSGDKMYGLLPIINVAEASLALFLKKNPVFLTSISIEGTGIRFDENQIQKILATIPKPIIFTEVGNSTLLDPIQGFIGG